jgi:prepilin-type N-terminal cleavage/methylation domain-containing protein
MKGMILMPVGDSQFDIKNFSLLKSFRNQNGFTLLEMAVALGVSVLSVVLFSGGFLTISKSSYFVQQTATRNSLLRMIRNSLMDHRAFQITANNDPMVHAIVTNDFSATGSILTNHFYDISIYTSAGLRISGTTNNPVHYMVDGTACPAGVNYTEGQCVIEVTSTVMAEGVPDFHNLDAMVSVASLPVVGYSTPSYPTGSPSLRAELILVNFEIKIFTKDNAIERKPSRGSVFINLRDLGF